MILFFFFYLFEFIHFFKEYHAQPPVVVLVQENVVLTDNLRIEQYINSRFTSLDLTSDKEAENVCSDLYIVSLLITLKFFKI